MPAFCFFPFHGSVKPVGELNRLHSLMHLCYVVLFTIQLTANLTSKPGKKKTVTTHYNPLEGGFILRSVGELLCTGFLMQPES